MDVRRPLFQNIACVLIGVLLLNPIVATAAQVTVDAQAGGNTSLSQAGNGVPIVNIATPSASGLSHNRYSDYNVGQQGLILNNATARTQASQLGGLILGNPNLNGQAAGVILNEVTGANASQLRGYTEVAGQSAHVIVANPHGITCDGCGFINTPRATLSTGKPVVADGRLQRYDVEGGQISVEGAGLNAGNVDQFELITRSAKLNAELHAKQLDIVAGRNLVEADSLAATAKTPAPGDAPALAIDSSALGGMYAGAIRLVGTEAGVGVKLAGDLAASAGDLIISSNGQLTVGKAFAHGNATLQAQDIELTDDVHANGNLRGEAHNELNNGKTLSARGDLSLVATDVYNNGALEAGVGAEGDSNPASVLRVESDYLENDGRITALGQLQVETDELWNNNGEIVSGQHGQVSARELYNQNGKLLGQSSLTLSTATLDNRAGTIASNQALHISASDSLDNQNDGLILAKAGDLGVDAHTLNNQGGVVQANQGALQLSGGQTNNQGGKLLAGQGDLAATQSQGLNNNAGLISALSGAVTVSATGGDVSNVDGRIQGQQLSVSAGSKLDNASGQVVSTQGDLSLSAGDELVNTNGMLQSQSQVTLNAQRLNNTGGQIGAPLINATLSDSLSNYAGLIEAAESLAITAGELDNADGRLRALGEMGQSSLGFNQLNNQSGLIEIGNARFTLAGDAIRNSSGTVRHVGSQGFYFNWAVVGLAGGDFITHADLSYSADEWTNESNLQANSFDLTLGNFMQWGGRLISVGDMHLRGGAINNDGLLASDGRLSMTLSGKYEGFGELQSLDDLSVDVGVFEQGEAAQARTAGNANVRVAGLYDSTGSFTSQGDFNLQAGQAQLQYATLGSDQQLTVKADTLDNNGLLFSGGDLALYVRQLRNTGSIYSLAGLTLAADESLAHTELLENLSATIESAGDMRLNVARLRNDRAEYLSEQRLLSGHISVTCYDCSGDHHNVDYVARETSQTHVLRDSGAALIHSGNLLQIAAGVVDNLKSTISATGNIGITADTLNNHGEAIEHVVRTQTFNTGRVTDGTDERFRANHIYPYNNAPLPKALPTALNVWSKTSDIETRTSLSPGAAAIIQAGGNVSIQATQSIDNDSVRSLQASQGSGGQSVDTGVTGQSQPLVVRLNSQAGPDSQQQAVDPLGLPSFSLPQGKGGLFSVVTQPGHRYLVETNPQFASLKSFLNSDYMLSRLGYAPDAMQKRLGDGLYEQRLIRGAVTTRTGQRFLAGLNSDEAMFRHLMDNAIASKDALRLSLGVSLTAEQVAALTHDIVWMEERQVMGQSVLVPVLYLAQANNRLAPSGALIQGQDVALISGSNLNNSGTLRASQSLSATANRIDNSGLMQADERIALLATDSIRNARGGIINGKDVSAIALTGDIVNERTITQESRSGKGFSQLTSVVDSAARIEASSDLSLSAGGDIRNIGGALKAGGDAELSAGGDLIIAAAEAENGQMRKDKRHFWSSASTTQHGSEVQVGGDLAAEAGADLAVIASQVKAAGDIALQAGGDAVIAAAANQSSSEYRYKGNGKKINKEDSTVRQQAAEIQAGGDLLVAAERDMALSASRLEAGGEAYLFAGEQLNLLAAQDSDYHLYDYSKKGSWGSKKTQRDETTSVRHVGSQIKTGGDLTLASGGDQLYQLAQLDSGADLTLDSGGAITFEAVKDLEQESYEKSKGDAFWNSMKGKGSTDETLRQSQLIAAGELTIKAVDGLRIDIKEVNQHSVSQTIDAMVAADPQLAWLKQAEARGDVDWRRVKEIHESFKYEHSGMGPAAQLIVAIVMAAITGGAGAALVGAQGAVTSAIANAAFTSLSTTAVSSTINNKGNLGVALKETFSSDSLKNAAVAGATAGLTAGVSDKVLGTKTDSVTGKVTTDLSSLEGVGRFAANQVIQQGGAAVLNKAMGRDVSFTDALQGALFSTLMATAFNAIGDYSQERSWADGSPQKIAMHALAGGLLAEATGGDFASGAIAAGANEALVKQLAALVNNDPTLLVMSSQLVGLAAAGLIGGDMEKGAEIARNATSYNYLLHQEVEDMLAERKRCGSDRACKEDVQARYADLDESRNRELASLCQTDLAACRKLDEQLQADAPKIQATLDRLRRSGDGAMLAVWNVQQSNQSAQRTIDSEYAVWRDGEDSRFWSDGVELVAGGTGGARAGSAIVGSKEHAGSSQGTPAREGAKAAGTAAHSSANGLRLSTQLAYEDAGILTRGGAGLTKEAVAASREIPISGGRLTNPAVVKELTANGSKIEDWGKFTTQSITLPSGQRSKIHYYMNKVTGELNLNIDFKVKGVVQ